MLSSNLDVKNAIVKRRIAIEHALETIKDPLLKSTLDNQAVYISLEHERIITDPSYFPPPKLLQILETPLESIVPDEYCWRGTEEILSMEFPDEEWLIDRVIPIEGFTIIAGPEACGKSFYTLTIANSLATGDSWLDQFPVKNKAKTLFIDKENTARRTYGRLKGLGIEDLDNCLYWVKYPEKFQIYDNKGAFTPIASSFSKQVKQMGIKFIVIDSMTDVIVGSENSQADTQSLFDALRQLFPGTSILMLHHISKPIQGVTRSSGQKFRGSTNINAQIYSGFLVEPVLETVNEFTIEQVKSGDSPRLPKFKVNLVSKINESNKSYISEIKYCGEVVDEEAKQLQGMKLINQAFERANEYYRQDLLNNLNNAGVSRATADRILRGMVNSGELKTKKESKRSIYYRFEEEDFEAPKSYSDD